MGIYIIIIGLIIIAIYIIATANSFVRLKKTVERSKSVVDVFLKKRYDLIPNLVECIKGYTKYEEDTLVRIVELRNSFNNNQSEEIKEELNKEFVKLVGVAESYPELKASEQFLNLQKNLSKVESEIQAARRIYINDLTIYNTKVETVPASIIAKMSGNRVIDLPKYDYEEVKINFNE